MSDFLRLPALLASNPLGALASFGLLRILNEAGVSVRLSFELRDDWIAQLHDSPFVDTRALVEWLVGWIAQRDTPELEWAEDVRVTPDEFRRQLEVLADDPRRQAFLSAMAAEGVADRNKGLVKPGPLYMTSGQQTLLDGLRKIFADVRKKPRERFEEAIAGPWRYSARLHSLGWDPATERIHALRWREPAKSDRADGPACVAGAVWLAFEAMPLLPCFVINRRVRCSAFDESGGDVQLTWPIFVQPIGVGGLRSLLQTGTYVNEGDANRTGVAQIYSSRRFVFSQGYAVFRPGRPSIASAHHIGPRESGLQARTRRVQGTRASVRNRRGRE